MYVGKESNCVLFSSFQRLLTFARNAGSSNSLAIHWPLFTNALLTHQPVGSASSFMVEFPAPTSKSQTGPQYSLPFRALYMYTLLHQIASLFLNISFTRYQSMKESTS